MRKANRPSICVFGHFAYEIDSCDGQTIKTRTITEYLKQTGFFSAIFTIDTCGWKKKPVSVLCKIFQSFFRCSSIIFLLSNNGRKIFYPFFFICKFMFPIRIYQIVIGGSLDLQIQNNKHWILFLNSFSANFVETYALKQRLFDLDVHNAIFLPNCKQLTILSKQELPSAFQKPIPICTFSRVMKEKGIEESMDAIIKINTSYKQIVFHLDIFGQIDKKYEERFSGLLKKSPDYIQYKGVIQSTHSTEVLKNYFLLLFLTHWENEGFAGAIIDAFSAGLPVIATNWGGNAEIIADRYTGRIVPLHDQERLISTLQEYVDEPMALIKMKQNCLYEAQKYTPEQALKPLIETIIKNGGA